jgi:hypothetical protein
MTKKSLLILIPLMNTTRISKAPQQTTTKTNLNNQRMNIKMIKMMIMKT